MRQASPGFCVKCYRVGAMRRWNTTETERPNVSANVSLTDSRRRLRAEIWYACSEPSLLNSHEPILTQNSPSQRLVFCHSVFHFIRNSRRHGRLSCWVLCHWRYACPYVPVSVVSVAMCCRIPHSNTRAPNTKPLRAKPLWREREWRLTRSLNAYHCVTWELNARVVFCRANSCEN